MKPIQVFTPAEVLSAENPAPLSEFNLQLLAQGDSWFSFGAIPPNLTTNLFDGMGTTKVRACVVNCAQPGARLSLMADTTKAPQFIDFLNGRRRRAWGGLLLSGGGNDLIAAAQQPPTNTAALRLLAKSDEWTSAPGGERYLSNAGWQTFCAHLVAVYQNLLVARDKKPENRGIAIVTHTYDIAVARDAGAGLGFGPWLYPAMNAFGIPEADRAELCRVLLDRLQTLIDHIAASTPDGSIHVVHGQGTLTAAKTSDKGATVDWQNEIHPSALGYRKLSARWQSVLSAVFNA
ncbi:hypothetical protein [uncultured Piscinibacter sp.]|uniref:hypothetical protein n=1 Tax=uncultured Piscinibacter sp. TaxID=1131835 RepID=UPI002625F82E|nr:hypothetical protein [uncultured Piscinibacter sp.]